MGSWACDLGSYPGKAMIDRIGVDITAVERLEGLARRHPQVLERLFSAGEIHDAEGQRNRWPTLASRFAAKEALIKAAGGLHGSRYCDIDVRRRRGHPPRLAVSGPLGDWLSDHRYDVQISLSHENAYAIALVILTHVGDEPDVANLDA